MRNPIGHILGSFVSQPTRSCLHVARMLSLPLEFQPLKKGEAYSAAYRSKSNPNSKFPVLTMHDPKDFTLYESTAIARYLCAIAPRFGGAGATVTPDQLYPASPEHRAKVDQVLDWHHSFLRVGAAGQVRRIVMKHHLPPEHSAHVDMAQTLPERDVRFLTHSLSVLEQQLAASEQSGHAFLCPPPFATMTTPAAAAPDAVGFTLGDVFVYQELCQLETLVPDPKLNGNLISGHPHIARWMARMAASSCMEEIVAPMKKFATEVAGVAVP